LVIFNQFETKLTIDCSLYMSTNLQQLEKLCANLAIAKQTVLLDHKYQKAHGLTYEYNRVLYLQSLNKYNKLTVNYKAIIDLICGDKFRF